MIGDTLLKDENISIFYIVKDEKKLDMISSQFKSMYPHIKSINIPAWDCMPYDNVSPSQRILGKRITSFIELIEDYDNTRVIFITINALIQKSVPLNFLTKNKITLKINDNLIINSFINFLMTLGYKKSSSVIEIGEYALRGGIIDVFTPNYNYPIRIDLFGEEIESIKFFDVLTQVSKEDINKIEIIPISEIIMTDENINNFTVKYRKLFGIKSIEDEIYQLVKEHQRINGLEHWISLFYDELKSIFEIIDKKYFVLLDNAFEETLQSRIEDINDYFNTRYINYNQSKKNKDTLNCYKPINISDLYLTTEQIENYLKKKTVIRLSVLKSANESNNLNSVKVKNFWLERKSVDIDFISAFINYVKNKLINKNKVIIACKSVSNRQKIYELLNNNGIYNINIKSNYFIDKEPANNVISLMILNISSGYIIDNLVVISDQDVFGKLINRKSSQKKQLSAALEEADSFNLGDYLVHKDYGVGKYNGLKTININKISQDCIELIYMADDKLLLPVQNIDLVSKFSGKLSEITLDKLGSKNWIVKKNKVKNKIRDMAEALIRIASRRKLGAAKKLYCSDEKYESFISKFPFYETQDQIDVINDVIEDINSNKPMDRLVCGDVGFGKTEVAIRASYIAIQSNVQVALIAPTTLLARQHFESYLDRFKNENINIVHISRLTSKKYLKSSLSDIQSGKANIIIGTHAILSDKIKFSNLGLFIIDEEQRFGVSQKEKIKNITSNVHILTLTATPIPRTLHMSLSGIKDLSIIATAPEDRVPVRTFVINNNDFNIKEGIKRELNRGGQVFCIVPRIKDIASIKDKIENLIDNISLGIIHGKMNSNDIEDTMSRFCDNKIKILLSTTIIENGLDIPNANTIFIFNADLFGLSQLYQLKGRVGRSNKRAYAYYLLDRKVLSSDAEKRIQAIQSLEGLGAGFSLAAHDLDIRGAGNLLGEEQSGQIKEVGLSLYQKLLSEAVNDIKGEKSTYYDWTPQINIQITALIPENYIADLSLRLQIYRRIGNIKSYKMFEQFEYEMIDRFGLIPEEFKNLISIMMIKYDCLLVGVNRIDSGINGAIIEFIDNPYLDPEMFIDYLNTNSHYLKMKSDKKLVINIKWQSSQERLLEIKRIINNLSSLKR